MSKINSNCKAKEFAEYLSGLSQDTPVSDKYGDRETLQKEYGGANQYEVQRNHVIYWFKKEETAEDNAKTVYDNLKDAGMILWIAESVSVKRDIVEQAAEKVGYKYMSLEYAKKVGKNGSPLSTHQANIVKQDLTWELIFDAITP